MVTLPKRYAVWLSNARDVCSSANQACVMICSTDPDCFRHLVVVESLAESQEPVSKFRAAILGLYECHIERMAF